MYRLVFIEKSSYFLYFKNQSQIIFICFWMNFMFTSYSCNFYNINVTNPSTFNVWHKVIKLIKSYSRREFLTCVINPCCSIKEQIHIVILNKANKYVFVFF